VTTHEDGKEVLKRALLELRDLRARVDEAERERHEPIAIVGIGCRFPGGASDPESYWRLLLDGIDAVTPVPDDRWLDEKPSDERTHIGAFLQQVDQFDADFFAIAHREAARTDPQQRLLLEVAWEAIENAGIAATSLAGSRTGVFAGISTNDYAHMQLRGADLDAIDPYFSTGTNLAVAAGRLSYVFGLRGPSLSVDTACSSSLAAVHLAVQSLRRGESEMALAAGVGLLLSPVLSVNFARARMLSAQGRCKTFDASADGYVRGEGCGVVVLKRLRDAVGAGDRIIAIIRGTAMNNDGRSAGLTAPNGPSQTSVIRDALADAQVAPRDVAFVEAHGTGTPLGDPIELRALADAYGNHRSSPLVVGSVKTNIGHLEAAAGMAGLIKAALTVQSGAIPPHLHFATPNPAVPWDELPIVIPTALTPWPEQVSRIGGVSAFGFSGTNVHVIVEEAPTRGQQASEIDRPLHLLTISAKTERALIEATERMRTALQDLSLPDAAFTANSGRVHFGERLAVIGRDAADVARALGDPSRYARGSVDEARDRPRVCFLFSEETARPAGMGHELSATEPAFRIATERGDTIEQCVAALWRSWGVEPDLLITTGSGEIAPAIPRMQCTMEEVPAAIRAAAGDGCSLFVEISPGTTLTAMAETVVGATCVPSFQQGRKEWEQLLESLATLYVHGAEIDWRGFDNNYVRQKVALPTYPFQRQRHWIPSTSSAVVNRITVSAGELDRFGARGMVHAGVYFDLVSAGSPLAIDEISFRRPLISETGFEMESIVEANGSFRIRSGGVVHASGRLRRTVESKTQQTPLAIEGRAIDANDFYAGLSQRGFDLVEDAQRLRSIVANDRQAIARIDASASMAIELAAQLVFVFAPEGAAFVLAECRGAHFRPGRAARCSVTLDAIDEASISGRFQISDEAGVELAAGELRLARTAPHTRRRIAILRPGAIDSIGVTVAPYRALGKNEIQIEVHAAGLNFGDVLSALDLENDAFAPGADCAGTVIAVGDDVPSFKIGDEVIALVPGALASVVLADAALVVPKPRNLSFNEAATIPICFLTAELALRAAHLQAGQRILIHAAAGGVGLAAVQLARRAGAEIVATAGTAAKRDFLRAEGIADVFDSRSPIFGDELRGTIDVAIGAVTGPIFDATRSTLTRGGRFVDLGKQSAPSANVIPFDLNTIDSVTRMAALNTIVRDLESGLLSPLPLRTFRPEDAAAAFRQMAQATHIGKLVIDFTTHVATQRPLIDVIASHAAVVLGRDAATIPIRKPLADLGMDSLMAIDLRDALSRELGSDLPATLLFRYPTIEALAQFLAASAETPEESDPLPNLSREETVALLDERLDALDRLYPG
jgi:3-oxoacyl-(acyl-carrier-protein) synthase/NADPH:quinone reductase-like Zn-dependent oxidoreductase/acyl carrier protein